ncbi:hypothetical protein BEP19_01795 [Ammoniphilus oxalaticus]|uniref:DUF4825 domain-containing protein n=1 Tax=Ammoniphilus oxalaticus TaxID=66863 RepID=A0A419SN27_9BACL|nr:hypothetical protein [Ammoniphilus oxalaticus]RKD25698.1 hypothetical protein BEP19_01795 [Ammoniphilus oxalaticus]
MILTRNLIVAIGLATMLALVISFLPTVELDREQGHTAVFQPMKRYELKEDNFVNVLSSFDTRLPISQVKWQNDNLFINYRIDKEKPIYVEEIYDDLFSVLQATYTLTTNVKGLYVRILYTDKGEDEVLIALSSERSEELEAALGQSRQKKTFLQEYTTLSYGVHWKDNIQ